MDSKQKQKDIFSSNLKRQLLIHNKTQADIVNDLKITSSTVSDWVNAKKYPRMDKVQMLADYLGIMKSDLIEDKSNDDECMYSQANLSFIKVPLYAPISCGNGAFVDDNILDYVAVPDDGLNPHKEYFAQIADGDSMIEVLYAPISCGNGAFVDDNILDYVAVPDDGLNPHKEYFAQIADGDSMIEVGIDSGDIIVFEKSNTIENGKIGCFCIDDNVATCKKFKKGDTFIQLIPANKNYDPIVIDLNNNNFRVIGILKKAIKNYE